jgi:hypothetical protein
MKWVIQKNLVNVEDHDKIQNVCIRQGYGHKSVEVVPFADTLPDVETGEPVIFYGATMFVYNIYKSGRWSPGVFFDEGKFTTKASIEHYREFMLNYPCEFTTIGEFSASHQPEDKLFFVRPVKDLKEFAGDVMEFNEVIKWERDLRNLPGCQNNPNLTVATEIAVSEPFGIAHEWRVFIVNGRVSSGSHYRSHRKLNKKGGLPNRVINFAEEMCKIWAPADVFVMDIGESSGDLYVIELNCFNSSGFYNSDVDKVVVDISESLAV